MAKPSLKDFKKPAESKNILEESAKVARAQEKPKKAAKEAFSKYISFNLTEAEYAALEDVMYKEKARNRSAFLRETIKKALNI